MRKFTTQILSLLTALSFAGALSAQTVEDAIATADNATGGNKLGLTVEGYFMYGLIGGSGEQNYDSLNADNLLVSTGAINYKFYGASAIGGGLNVGYEIADGLDVVAGFKFGSYSAPDIEATTTSGALLAGLPLKLELESDYNKLYDTAIAIATVSGSTTSAGYLGVGLGCIADANSCVNYNTNGTPAGGANASMAGIRTSASFSAAQVAMAGMWAGTNAANLLATGSYTGKVETSFTTMTTNLGLRNKVKAWGGELYAGAGLNIALPTTITSELTLGGAPSTFTFDSATIERKFGMNLTGLYGELGYNYDVMPNLYVGGGIRMNFNVPNDDGESKTITFKKAGTTVLAITQTSSASHTTADESYTGSGTAYSQKVPQKTFGITDVQVNLNVGYRL